MPTCMEGVMILPLHRYNHFSYTQPVMEGHLPHQATFHLCVLIKTCEYLLPLPAVSYIFQIKENNTMEKLWLVCQKTDDM